MLNEAALASFVATLFSMMNPIGNVGVFAGMTADRAEGEVKQIAWVCAFAAAVTLIVVAWTGSVVMAFFGVSVDSLRAAGGVIVLLIGLTALVIVGLASYFVSQRTRQIGTRRALGATRFDILRYFLLENWLITTLGAFGGCLLTMTISYLLETNFDLPRLDFTYLVASIVALWFVSQFAAYWPARKEADIPPAVATRY